MIDLTINLKVLSPEQRRALGRYAIAKGKSLGVLAVESLEKTADELIASESPCKLPANFPIDPTLCAGPHSDTDAH